MTIHKALLGIRIFEVDTNFIYEYTKNKDNRNLFDLLPEYTFDENDSIIEAESYLEYTDIVEESKNVTHLFFDVSTLDGNIEYEMGVMGTLEFLNDIKSELKTIVNILPHQPTKDINKRCFDLMNYIIIDIVYESSYDYYSGTNDWDVNYIVDGYLNHNMEKIKI